MSTYELRDPLLSPVKGLQDCILAIRDKHSLVDPRRAIRLAAKVGSAALSLIAKIPYFPISLRLGNPYGPITAVGNTLGFFLLEFWAASATLDGVFGPKTSAEIELLKNGEKTTCRNTWLLPFAAGAALASQLPTALAGAEYNQPEYKYTAFLVLMIAGSLIPVRSLQLSAEKLRLYVLRNTESKIAKIKAEMIALIEGAQQRFISQTRSEKEEFMRSFDTLTGQDDLARSSHYLLKMASVNPPSTSTTSQYVSSFFDNCGLVLGTVFAGIADLAIGEFTFALSKAEIADNDFLAGIFAALGVSTSFYLFTHSIIRTTRRSFKAVGDKITGEGTPSFGGQLKPSLNFGLTALGLMIDVIALGPTYVIWGDFYDQDQIQKDLFQTTMLASLFLFLFTSTQDIVSEIVTSPIAKPTQEEQNLIDFNQDFQKLISLIKNCPSRAFIDYLLNLEKGQHEELLQKLNIQAGQLQEYAQKLQMHSA